MYQTECKRYTKLSRKPTYLSCVFSCSSAVGGIVKDVRVQTRCQSLYDMGKLCVEPLLRLGVERPTPSVYISSV